MKKSKGYGMAEYLVGLVAIYIILFEPWLPPAQNQNDRRSVADVLIEAVKQEHAAYLRAQAFNVL
ncbi:MAG: hypothetical protein HWE13_00685 [Gammaproteobacteria bacterium]|nr:hypothetical protein [Gammaproteobacteria bacterium]NVK86604.1 hypothetical protein [Gammaproteobacteria bacterium]